MARVLLSRLAKAELRNIDEYTTGEWGEMQADRYLSRFHSHLGLLAEMPGIGGSGTTVKAVSTAASTASM